MFGFRRVYLDYNAGAPLDPRVARAMRRARASGGVNAASLHTPGRVAKGLIEEARRHVAALLDTSPDRLYFTGGGSEANSAVLKGVWHAAALNRRPGEVPPHLVTTRIEHESVLAAARQIETLGGRVTYLPAGADGRVTVDAIRGALRSETALVSMMHANNETGAVQPVMDIAALCREAGMLFHTDAVQSLGKIPVHPDEIGCDFLTMSAHKIHGPQGVGALWWNGRSPWLALVNGGGQERGRRGGTENLPGLVGFGAAAELAGRALADPSRPAREAGLRAQLLDGIRQLCPEAVLHEAPPGSQLPLTVNVAFPGHESIDVLAGLDCRGVSVSVGSACTAERVEPSHVLLGMGYDDAHALTSLRFSLGRGTTAADVRYALSALGKALAEKPKGLAWLDPQRATPDRLASAWVADVRWPYERMIHAPIAGAHCWTPLVSGRKLKEAPRGREVILMCETGLYSYAAGYRLTAGGHPCVKVIYGGYAAWRSLHPQE